MGLGHNRPGTWYWDNNWALLHYRTWTQLASNSVILGHNGPATLYNLDTMGLVHNGMGPGGTQWDWDTMGLVHCRRDTMGRTALGHNRPGGDTMGWGREHYNGTGTQNAV